MVAKTRSLAKASLYAGTSGWAYASWKPGFYPKDVPAKRFLEHYASRLNTVEVNYTFRQLPSAAMVESWLAATPEGFRFTFKAPQQITHFKRLKECDEPLEQLLASVAAVRDAGRMGALLFQLPPNFKLDTERLKGLLGLPALRGAAACRVAFEFRHPSWFAEEVFEILRDYDTALCVAESDELETPDVRTASFAYYRLRRSTYSALAMKGIADRLTLQAKEHSVYAYFKHEDAPDGPLRAEELLRRARGTAGSGADDGSVDGGKVKD